MLAPSPLAMPARRVEHAAPATLVYSTSTGDTPRGDSRYVPEPDFDVDPDPYCFVCGRPTDHVAEHDELVAFGLAYYTGDGSVHRTDRWDADLARKINEDAYQAYRTILGFDEAE